MSDIYQITILLNENKLLNTQRSILMMAIQCSLRLDGIFVLHNSILTMMQKFIVNVV